MYKTIPEAVELASELKKELADCKEKLMIAPPFTALHSVAQVIKGSNILLGAQKYGPLRRAGRILARFRCLC